MVTIKQLELRSFYHITLLVMVSHLLLLAYMTVGSPKVQSTKKLEICHLEPMAPAAPTISGPPSPIESPPPAISSPLPSDKKEVTPRVKTPTTPKAASKPSTRETAAVTAPVPQDRIKKERQKQLVAEARAELAQAKQFQAAPKPVETLSQKTSATPSMPSGGRASETHFIVQSLQQQITLPEHGEVTLLIETDSKGAINRITILQCNSTKNARYLEETLPRLKVPTTTCQSLEVTLRTTV